MAYKKPSEDLWRCSGCDLPTSDQHDHSGCNTRRETVAISKAVYESLTKDANLWRRRPAAPDERKIRYTAGQIREFIRANSPSGTCRILSLGRSCPCVLCDVDRLMTWAHGTVELCDHRFNNKVCVAWAGHEGPHLTSDERFVHGRSIDPTIENPTNYP